MKRCGRRWLSVGSLVVIIFLALSTPAGAAMANISTAYGTAGSIPDNRLVSLDPQNSSDVVLADFANQKDLLGVSLNSSDSLIAVNAGTNKIQVATSGEAVVLVSNINGPINTGDQVGVSPFAGVGMKAESDTEIIGYAQQPFNGTGSNVQTKKVISTSGKTSLIKLGYIAVTVSVSRSTGGSTQPLTSLQKIGKSLTGKVIPTSRIVLSMVVAAVAFLGLVTLVYSSIYGSIVSIGRNPLAKSSIYHTLVNVLEMVIITALVATSIIYLLLQ